MPGTPGQFIWYEMLTTKVDAAATFYGAVVGWTADASPQAGMDYRLWSIGGQAVGGLMKIPADAAAAGMRPAWLGYVSVDDVDASVAAMKADGGTALMPAMDVPNVGRMALVADPQGAAFYVMKPMGEGPSPAHAAGVAGHGGWHELHTTDWSQALAFYAKHLGWGKSDALDMGPMGTYLLFNAGGEAIGGIMNNPNFPRPMWVYYFNVATIDAAKDRLIAAGGEVVMGPMEVPGGGWVLQGRDDQGALFALFAPVKE